MATSLAHRHWDRILLLKGSHIWVGDSEELVLIDGIVTNIDGAEAEIQTSDGRMVTQILFSSIFFFSNFLVNKQL